MMSLCLGSEAAEDSAHIPASDSHPVAAVQHGPSLCHVHVHMGSCLLPEEWCPGGPENMVQPTSCFLPRGLKCAMPLTTATVAKGPALMARSFWFSDSMHSKSSHTLWFTLTIELVARILFADRAVTLEANRIP